MKKIFSKSNILSFILGALIFGCVAGVSAYVIYAGDIQYTPSDSTWKKSNGENITNVEEAIDALYNISASSNLEYIDNVFTYDGNRAKINYTATQKITLIAIGNGTCTNQNGTTNVSMNTTGVSTTLVDGRKLTPASTAYSTTYIYKVELDEGDTFSIEVYSSQGHTSNNAILLAVK